MTVWRAVEGSRTWNTEEVKIVGLRSLEDLAVSDAELETDLRNAWFNGTRWYRTNVCSGDGGDTLGRGLQGIRKNINRRLRIMWDIVCPDPPLRKFLGEQRDVDASEACENVDAEDLILITRSKPRKWSEGSGYGICSIYEGVKEGEKGKREKKTE